MARNPADRPGRDRTPSIPGHEVTGVVSALGYGTRGLSVGQRVFGLADWTRDGTLAEYVAIEARNVAPLPGDVDITVGASLPISGLTGVPGTVRRRVRDGRLRTNIDNVASLDDAVAALNPTERIKGKIIIRVRP